MFLRLFHEASPRASSIFCKEYRRQVKSEKEKMVGGGPWDSLFVVHRPNYNENVKRQLEIVD